MEERILHRLRRQHAHPTHDTHAAGPPALPQAPAVDALLDTQVTVISGAYVQSLPLANQTVSNVRQLLQASFNIGPQALALINGRPVTGETVLRQGDMLEFVHHAGEKGLGAGWLWHR
jgi:hypothetical protein